MTEKKQSKAKGNETNKARRGKERKGKERIGREGKGTGKRRKGKGREGKGKGKLKGKKIYANNEKTIMILIVVPDIPQSPHDPGQICTSDLAQDDFSGLQTSLLYQLIIF